MNRILFSRPDYMTAEIGSQLVITAPRRSNSRERFQQDLASKLLTSTENPLQSILVQIREQTNELHSTRRRASMMPKNGRTIVGFGTDESLVYRDFGFGWPGCTHTLTKTQKSPS